MDSHPIRIHEAAPKAVASSIVFLTAWLAGTTGYCLVCDTFNSIIDTEGIC